MTDNNALVSEILLTTSDDWSDAEWIVSLAMDETETIREANELALRTIIECLESGLLIAGDLGLDGFHPWEATVDEAIARIKTSWAELGDEQPEPDSIAWFDLGPAGAPVAAKEVERFKSEQRDVTKPHAGETMA